MIYVCDKDRIGSINIRLFQTRRFLGPWAGFYEVMPMVAEPGFLWEHIRAVMDDFGNLVAVEG